MGTQKKSLLLVTAGFPFGESERSFLSTEVEQLCKAYRLYILAKNNSVPLIYPVGDDISCGKYDEGFTYWNVLREVVSVDYLREVLSAVKDNRRSLIIKMKRAKWILAYGSNARKLKKQMEQIVREQRIDVIYTYWGVPATLCALRLKRKNPGLKVVSRFYGCDLYNERLETLWQPYRKVFARECDGLFFVSHKGKAYFDGRWGGNTMLSYLGTPRQGRIKQRDSERLVLVSCSNLIELKRVDLIIKALSLLPDDCKVDWHAIGDGDKRASLEKLSADDLLCRPNISWKFHGYVKNHELFRLYSEISTALFITTSSTEGGAPVSIQEVFSMGIPAVGTGVGGIPELIQDNKTGFLLGENPTPEEVAEKIEAFYRLPHEKKAQMGEYAHQLWERNFDAERNAREFCERLGQIAESAASGP